MNRANYINQIIAEISILRYIVYSSCKASRYNVNHDCETFYAKFLNILWNCNFKNTNTGKRNYPAIDLADEGKKIAIQVTSNTSEKKVSKTIEKIIEKEFNKRYETIYMLYIKSIYEGKKRIDVKINGETSQRNIGNYLKIIGVDDLIEQVDSLDDIDKLKLLCQCTQKEIGVFRQYLKDSSSLLINNAEFQQTPFSSLNGLKPYLKDIESFKENLSDFFKQITKLRKEQRKVIFGFLKIAYIKEGCAKTFLADYNAYKNVFKGDFFVDPETVRSVSNDSIFEVDGATVESKYYSDALKVIYCIDFNLWQRIVVDADFSVLDETGLSIDRTKLKSAFDENWLNSDE